LGEAYNFCNTFFLKVRNMEVQSKEWNVMHKVKSDDDPELVGQYQCPCNILKWF